MNDYQHAQDEFEAALGRLKSSNPRAYLEFLRTLTANMRALADALRRNR